MALSSRNRLVLALTFLALVPLMAAVRLDWSAATAARVLLGVAAAGTLVAWLLRARAVPRFRDAPRMVVLQRVGLAPRTGMALVEVDGRPFIVVHGEGYARIRPAPRPTVVRS